MLVNAENLGQCKSTFFIVKQIVTFTQNTNFITEVINMRPNFKEIA